MSPRLIEPPTANLAASAAAASATCAASAAKAGQETEIPQWWTVHWGIGGHGGHLYAPKTRHFSQTGGLCSSPQATG